MTKCKTRELTGAALDWAAGLAEKLELNLYGVDPSIRARVPGLGVHAPWSPSKYWNQAGPIIEREGIGYYKANGSKWWAHPYGGEYNAEGPTVLVAAMRCYVANKLGDEVEVPATLLPSQATPGP